MLELLVGEANQRLDHDLVAERVAARHFQHLRSDGALDRAEHVGIRATLDLADESLLGGGGEAEGVDLRERIGHVLALGVELPVANDVLVNVPADALGSLDALGITGGAAVNDCGVHSYSSCGESPPTKSRS